MRKLGLIAILSSGLALVGCGGDGTTSGSGQLSDESTSAVTSAVGTVVQSATVAALTGSKLNARALITIDHVTHEVNDLPVTCNLGGSATVSGSVSVDGTIDTGASNINIEYGIDATFTGCKVAGSDGKTYTIDGDLAIGGTGEYNSTTTDSVTSIELTANSTETGTLSVEGENASVTDCEVDYSSTSNASGSGTSYAVSGSWEGSFCGADSSGDYSFST